MPIPLVDVMLPVEGVDLLGRHGGRVGRGGRQGAGGRGIGRGREGGGRLSQRQRRLEADGVGVSWMRSDAAWFVLGVSAQPLGEQIHRLFNIKYTKHLNAMWNTDDIKHGVKDPRHTCCGPVSRRGPC